MCVSGCEGGKREREREEGEGERSMGRDEGRTFTVGEAYVFCAGVVGG